MWFYVTWLIEQLNNAMNQLSRNEEYWLRLPLLAALLLKTSLKLTFDAIPPSAFICDRWPLTNGNSAWWRRRTNCRYCATARSRWLSSVRATSCTSMRAPTWTRFSSSTPSTTNPTSLSLTRILSRWVHLSVTDSQDERGCAKDRSIDVIADFFCKCLSLSLKFSMKKYISHVYGYVYMPRSRQQRRIYRVYRRSLLRIINDKKDRKGCVNGLEYIQINFIWLNVTTYWKFFFFFRNTSKQQDQFSNTHILES